MMNTNLGFRFVKSLSSTLHIVQFYMDLVQAVSVSSWGQAARGQNPSLNEPAVVLSLSEPLSLKQVKLNDKQR